MRRAHADSFRHPVTGDRLTLRADVVEGDEIIEGGLTAGADTFPIVRGIPRFCPAENYAESFGYQWQTFATTQLDSQANWTSQSERRLFEETRWPRDLRGERILEAGSGMGRFTEVLARTGAEVHTFDYSAAVDANRGNVGAVDHVSFAQADIFSPPYEHGSFDKVLCLGVIQHTPDPERAFKSLCRFLKPGGSIVVDIYWLNWKSLFMGKYYLRPLTRRLPSKALHRFVKLHVGWTYPLTGLVQKVFGPRARALSHLFALADYRGIYGLDDRTAREHSELDTFDLLAPAFDKPQTLATVGRWLREAGLEQIEVHPGYNGLEARGVRPR